MHDLEFSHIFLTVTRQKTSIFYCRLRILYPVNGSHSCSQLLLRHLGFLIIFFFLNFVQQRCSRSVHKVVLNVF